MDSMEYFSIGWRAENSIKELEKIKNREKGNRTTLEDAYDLVKPFISIAEKNLEKVVGKPNFGILIRLVYGGKGETITNPEELKKIKKRMSDISVTGIVMEDILREIEVSDANLDIAIKTFGYLNDKCLEYSQPERRCF